MFVMGKAFADCYPKALLSVNYQLHNSMFCQIDNMKVTTEMIDKVRERMKQIIKADLPITKTVMSLEEAKAMALKSDFVNNHLPKEIIDIYCK